MKVLVLLMTILSLTLSGKSPPDDTGALKTLSKLKEAQNAPNCEKLGDVGCDNKVAIYSESSLPDD